MICPREVRGRRRGRGATAYRGADCVSCAAGDASPGRRRLKCLERRFDREIGLLERSVVGVGVELGDLVLGVWNGRRLRRILGQARRCWLPLRPTCSLPKTLSFSLPSTYGDP